MAQTKISALTELLAASIDTADVLPIVDTSAVATKKVTVASLDSRYVLDADINAKGDLFVGTADNTTGVLTVGANDTIPVADSATGTGIKWAAPATVRTALGLGNAAQLTVDADLATFTVPASTTISAYGATLVDDANAAAAIATLGLDADIATLSLPASTTISTFGASLVDDADAAAARTTIGLDFTTLDERIRDTIGTALVAGTNVTITVNDAGDTITIAATGGGGAFDQGLAHAMNAGMTQSLQSYQGY